LNQGENVVSVDFALDESGANGEEKNDNARTPQPSSPLHLRLTFEGPSV
jgi:hypothetical protein